MQHIVAIQSVLLGVLEEEMLISVGYVITTDTINIMGLCDSFNSDNGGQNLQF